MLKVHEVIVVEGKTDTQKLQKVLGSNVKTIETHGLRLDRDFFAFLNQINQSLGLIIFTDPDAAGQKIRQRLLTIIEGPVKQAFLPKTAFSKTQKKKGVAEADEQILLETLQSVMTFDSHEQYVLSWSDYLKLGLNNKNQRVALATKLKWPLTLTNKTFFKWLNWSGHSKNQIEAIMGV